MNLHDKLFVVTGAGSGIGKELVLQLLSRGARIAAVDLRGPSLLDLQQETGVSAEILSLHTLDISDKLAVSELPAAVTDAHGAIDGLINCAGIIQPFVPLLDLDYDAIERVMNVNFYGTLFMTKAFLPLLLARPEASLVNVSSMGGFLPVPGQSVYCASKAAVKLLTEGLYAELADTSVRVSLVLPGATDTNINKNSNVEAPSAPTGGQKKSHIKILPAGEAALTIIKGIEKSKRQIFTGRESKLLDLLHRLNPAFASKLVAKEMKSMLK